MHKSYRFLNKYDSWKRVTLVNDSKNPDSDSYGRLLGHVYVNDTFVNYEIIKQVMHSGILTHQEQILI